MPQKTKKEEIQNKQKIADIEKNKLIASLSYFWILFLIPLIARPKSKYCQHHSKQGFVLFLLSPFTAIPFIGWVLGIVLIVLSIIGILKTLDGEWWSLIPQANKKRKK